MSKIGEAIKLVFIWDLCTGLLMCYRYLAVSLSFGDTIASHFPVLTYHVISFRLFVSSRMLRSWNQVRITALILERSRMCNSFLCHDLPSDTILDIFPEPESSWEQFQAHTMCILLFMFCYFWKINCPVCMYKRLYFQFWESDLRSFITFHPCAASSYCYLVQRWCILSLQPWCTRISSQTVHYQSTSYLGFEVRSEDCIYFQRYQWYLSFSG